MAMSMKDWDEINKNVKELIFWLRKPGNEKLNINISRGAAEVYDITEKMDEKEAVKMADKLIISVLRNGNKTILGYSKLTLLQFLRAAKGGLMRSIRLNQPWEEDL